MCIACNANNMEGERDGLGVFYLTALLILYIYVL